MFYMMTLFKVIYMYTGPKVPCEIFMVEVLRLRDLESFFTMHSKH